MRDEEVQKTIEKYCNNEMSLLKKVCYPIIAQFGGVADFEYEDFWSIANETVWLAAVRFDDSIHDSFDNYLKGCLQNKFKSIVTKKNRKKRIPVNCFISLDSPISEDSDKKISEVLDSGYRLSDDIKELQDDDGLEIFISGLSKKQYLIVDLIIQGYEKDEIKKRLCMTDKRYETCIGMLRSFENRILLSGGTSRNA